MHLCMLICYVFNFIRVVTFIRYILVNFKFGLLDRVLCIGDFVIPGVCSMQFSVAFVGLKKIGRYTTTLIFGLLPLVEIDHVTRYCLSSADPYQCIVPVLAIFAQNLALCNKNNTVLLSQALCVICSLGNFDVQTTFSG